jgi:hypothetical protein
MHISTSSSTFAAFKPVTMIVFSNAFNLSFTQLVRFLFLFMALLSFSSIVAQENLKLHFGFTNVSGNGTQVNDESGNGYTGALLNGAVVKQIGSFSMLDLGSANGYLSFSSSVGSLVASLQNFTVATYVWVDASTTLTSDGNFVWAFGNSNNMASAQNGGMFFTAKTTRFAISLKHWTGEQSVSYGSALAKGTWKHVAYVQSGTTGTVYVDGTAVKTGSITLQSQNLGTTLYNYIGRSLYSTDAYLKNSLITDFRIYNTALEPSEVTALALNLTSLNNAFVQQQLFDEAALLDLGDLSAVKSNINLPLTGSDGIAISWISSNAGVVSNSGVVTRPAIGAPLAQATLTATLSKSGFTETKQFVASVLPWVDDQTSVANDAAALQLTGNLNNLRADLVLPLTGDEASTISWSSSQPEYLAGNGRLMKLSPIGQGKLHVVLTATVTKGSESIQQAFDVWVAEDEGFSAYLFAYFTGNDISQEAIRFALSNDGYNYLALNNNNPIISSAAISETGGVRDPHIYRGPDGNYYMVVTDMVSANGWNSNRGMVLLKSADLVTWTSSTVNIQTKYPNQQDILRVWAPQVIYDEVAGKFMVYFSMKHGTGPDIIYYAYTNSSFTDLEGVPQQLFYHPTNGSCIDGDIIFKDGEFHLFFKTEGSGNGIKKAVSTKLTEGYVLYDNYLQQTTAPVEGSSVFKLINSDEYILMYDMYTSGKYQFTKSTDLTNFKLIDNQITMNFTPRHGTVMPITADEADRLTQGFATNVVPLPKHTKAKLNVSQRNGFVDVWGDATMNGTLSVFDMQGRCVVSTIVNSPVISIDSSRFIHGQLYVIVHVGTDSSVSVAKLLCK